MAPTQDEKDNNAKGVIECLWEGGWDTFDIADIIQTSGTEKWRSEWTEARVSWHVDNYIRRKALKRLT